MLQRLFLFFSVFSLTLLVGACDVLSDDSVPTAIFVTATRPPQFVVITNSPEVVASAVINATSLATEVPPETSLEIQQTLENTTPTATPSPTQIITNTPSFTPTPTDTPPTPGAVLGPVGGFAVIVDGNVTCPTQPDGGFAAILSNNPDLQAQMGCPLGEGGAVSVNNAFQRFQSGAMLWVSSLGAAGGSTIYAVLDNGTYQRFNDTWVSDIDPVSVGATPPDGLVEPIRGFGKVWRESPDISEGLGWATDGEQGGNGFVQTFERGEMIYVPQNGQIYLFIAGQPGVWTSIAGEF